MDKHYEVVGNDYSKSRLLKLIEEKFQTAAIGSIASIETKFGELWGHGEQPENVTQAQANNRGGWQSLRKEILDKVHEQKRKLINELENYSVKWDRYHMEFILQDPRQDPKERDI